MSIPAQVRDYLRRSGGTYQPVLNRAGTLDAEALGSPGARTAKASLLKSAGVRLMAIYPADHTLDLANIERLFKRRFEPLSAAEVAALAPYADPQALPPLPELYGLRAVLDPRLDGAERIYFGLGARGLFARTDSGNFQRLVASAWRRTISYRAAGQPQGPGEPSFGPDSLDERARAVDALPPMPGIATQIIRLRDNPYAHISELAAVIEQDPSLAAQIVRYAGSPYFNYQGKVDSVAMAISRVLGMDFVLDLAFGLSLAGSFRHGTDGPLGVTAFWRHAVHAAALSQALCNQIDYLQRPSPGLAYLCGLLHNFGFLVLGHLAPEQFERLNGRVAAEPQRPVTAIERELLGVDHTELGCRLAESWRLPVEVVEAMRGHHDPARASDFAVYARLVYLANALLRRHGIGESFTEELPAHLLQQVGLDESRAEAALQWVLLSRGTLERMACQIAA